jgi:hypothetical protein
LTLAFIYINNNNNKENPRKPLDHGYKWQEMPSKGVVGT